MQEDNIYKPSREYRDQMKMDAEGYADFIFYLEIAKVKDAEGLSEEMKLVIELILQFQWLEERMKDLLWYLYGSMNTAQAQIFFNSEMKGHIRKLRSRAIVDELRRFTEKGHADRFNMLATSFEEITKVRNDIMHKLYSQELKTPKRLNAKITNTLQKISKLITQINETERDYQINAAVNEMRTKSNEG